MENSFELTILFTLALVAGIAAQVLANFVKVPSIVFLLLFGVLLGPDGLGWVRPQIMGSGLEALVSLAVALILFEGGLNLRLQRLNQVSDSLRNLVLLGSLLTLGGGALAAHYLGEFPWPLAFLFGSLVVVTGPTVINPILKRVRVDPAVSTLLEGEGVLIDPVGAILAVVVLQVVLSGHPSFLLALEQLSSRLAIGSAVGALGGWLMGSFLLWSRQFLTEELRNSVVLAGALGVFALAQSLRSEAGLMAVVMAGLVVRQKAAIAERSVRQFHGQLVVMAISVLFILLTSTLSLKAVLALGWGALATVLCLMLVVRPLSVWLCTWGSDLNWRQKLFVAWLAPRGIVAASVASLFAILLTERGITGGDALKALVFLTISVTVTVQGLTAAWVARWLGLDQGSSTVIIGNHPLVGQLAQLLRSLNQAVEVLPLPSGSRLRERTANLPAELNGHKAGHTSGTHPASGNGSSKALPVRVSGTESSEEPGQVLPGSLQEAVLSESAFLKADIDHAETLLILTLDPQMNWAIAELMVKLSVSAAIWTVLLPEMPISEGIRTLPIPFSQLQRWASYLEANRAELRSITLPTLADLGLKPPQSAAASAQESIAAARSALLNPFSAQMGLEDPTLERLRDQFAYRIKADLCLPLLLVRPQRLGGWFGEKGKSSQVGRLFYLPEPGIWRRGDCIYYLERTSSPVEAVAPSARELDPPEWDPPSAELLPQYVEGVKLHFDL
ncbi:cation:proton antiporter [Synechococcus sp. 65AY6Li]|uniref:cation:proton antiporter n=1 Tax=Synechococcus sp. 65AY6Li TaxID=1351840 RepID=UPI000C1864ED|nr:sodium:proton antiporter [Synechococcus sp. 65AY6Li]PIK92915.1 cation:proton antiporter [Synechococcus sp. 65AY6Li]